MTSKIFKAVFSVAAAVLLACLTIVTGVLHSYFGSMQQSQLKDELKLVASATERLGEDYLSELNSDSYRLTWVAADGTVLFDSKINKSSMANHADREEIKAALASGTGSCTRYSATLTEETVYEATRLEDGSVLRISVSRATLLTLVLGMLQPIVLIVLIAITLSAWLARRMAKQIVEPLNKLNLEKPMDNDTYEEISPLLNRIYALHQKIRYQVHTLERKQNEFAQITGNMKEALVLVDNTGRIISINPAAMTLFGVDKKCIGEDFLSIDRKPDMRMAMKEAQEEGHAYFNAKMNGRCYQFDISRIESAEDICGLVVLAFDITEQVHAEQHRREFTANVSHELKTPLQSIIGSAELIENGIVKQEDMPRFIGHIQQEASRLLYLIDDIIRLSQLDEVHEWPREDVSLHNIAIEVCASLVDAAKARNVSMEVSGDAGVINGVRGLLYEVIYNLCDNAVKYNNLDGFVKVAVTEGEGFVELSVSDSGIGIAPEHREKIFERFYRVDKSHSKQSGGTGLGLSIVKHAVQYHHGKIFVDSEQNKGTVISVIFDTKSS